MGLGSGTYAGQICPNGASQVHRNQSQKACNINMMNSILMW